MNCCAVQNDALNTNFCQSLEESDYIVSLHGISDGSEVQKASIWLQGTYDTIPHDSVCWCFHSISFPVFI